MDATLRFRLLGGLAVERVGPESARAELDLGGPQPRRVLAALLLSLHQPLPPDRLMALVWGDDAPASARGSLQACISNLRRVLEPDRRPAQPSQAIVLRSGGYVLVADRAQLDIGSVEQAVDEGAAALARRRPAEAIVHLTGALDAWGPLLPELGDAPFVRVEADRLDARRQAAFELLQTSRLEVGAHHDAIADLRGAVAEDPRAERLWGLLALALYRAGRPSDAIDTVHQARVALRAATGLDLGPELRRLEADLYAQAPTLDPTPVAPAAAVDRVDRVVPSPRPPCRHASRTRRAAPGGTHIRRW